MRNSASASQSATYAEFAGGPVGFARALRVFESERYAVNRRLELLESGFAPVIEAADADLRLLICRHRHGCRTRIRCIIVVVGKISSPAPLISDYSVSV